MCEVTVDGTDQAPEVALWLAEGGYRVNVTGMLYFTIQTFNSCAS